MAELFEWTREKGLATVETSAVKENHAALVFYNKPGFVRIGKIIDDETQRCNDLASVHPETGA